MKKVRRSVFALLFAVRIVGKAHGDVYRTGKVLCYFFFAFALVAQVSDDFSLRFIKVASVFFNAASPPEYMMIIAPFERKKVNRALTCGKTFEKIQKFFRRGGKYDLKNGERETYDFFGTIY